MFTGIIAQSGIIKTLSPTDGGLSIVIDIGRLDSDAEIGDSIAVNGACLTITRLDKQCAHFDVSNETLSKTTLGIWQVDQRVNLEPALRLGDKLGGHMVSGHVDGVGSLLDRQSDGDCETLTFQLPDSGSVNVVEKGSIAIDGISLTCFNCMGNTFQVAVIPHTLMVTNLGQLPINAPVHMEQDMIGRWVAKLLPSSG